MTFARRNLPHWQPDHAALFLTWRLAGSLPPGVGASKRTLDNQSTDGLGHQFVRMDLALDSIQSGPRWLKSPPIASCVERAIVRGDAELKQYRLIAYVIMPNHVHILIEPLVNASRIMRGIKGVSAHAANQILNRSEGSFWQDESYDHWVRSETELWKIQSYIELNPVRAGLTLRAQDWRWSSAWFHPHS